MATAEATFEVETPEDFGDDASATAARWISEISLAEKNQERWLSRGRKIIRLYMDMNGDVANDDAKKRRFALLWSNMETLEPACFARIPNAVVSRRWKDIDPVGRVASEVLERALNFSLEAVDFIDVMEGVTKEYLLLARGVTWVRYVPHMETVQPPPVGHNGGPPLEGERDPEGGEQEASDGQVDEGQESYEVVAWEEAVPDHVSYDDFLTNNGRKWSEVRWCGRRAYLDRDECKTRFRKKLPNGQTLGEVIPLDHGTDANDSTSSDDNKEQFAKAAIYEIWDKPSRKVFWVSKSYSECVLDERDDPLGLEDFFPCPRPALGTRSPSSLLPQPDYTYYESQDRDINELTVRIGLLTDALKVVGFYSAGGEQKEKLADLLTNATNIMVPIDSWAAWADKGGIKGLVEWLPLEVVATTLKSCIEARTQLVNDVYQLTGISDIMRGDVDPDETATATNKKETWGSSRVRKKQKELARVARDTLAIMGQVIASKFSTQTLGAMTNVQLLPDAAAKQQLQAQLQAQAQQYQLTAQHLQSTGQQPPPPPQVPPQIAKMLTDPTWEEVMGLLRDNTLRTFRIDVETDSTIEPNDQDEKQRRIEFVEAIGEFMAKSMPVVQLQPQLLPVVIQALLFLVRGFRVGREMEDVIDKAADALQAAAGQPQPPKQPTGPDPKVEAARAQAASTTAQARVMDAQTNQFRAQTDRAEAQAGAQLDAQRIQQEGQQAHLDRVADAHGQQVDISADLQKAVVKGVERHFVHDMNSPQPIRAPTE